MGTIVILCDDRSYCQTTCFASTKVVLPFPAMINVYSITKAVLHVVNCYQESRYCTGIRKHRFCIWRWFCSLRKVTNPIEARVAPAGNRTVPRLALVSSGRPASALPLHPTVLFCTVCDTFRETPATPSSEPFSIFGCS
jgi:hypothetical protein